MSIISSIKNIFSSRKRTGQSSATKQTTAKNKRNNVLAIVSASLAVFTVVVLSFLTYLSNTNRDEMVEASRTVTNSSLSSGDLKKIRDAFSSKTGLEIIGTNDSNIDSWGGALDVYFEKQGQNVKKDIADKAGVSHELTTLTTVDMAKFVMETKDYNNGEYRVIYDTAKDNFNKVAKLSDYSVSSSDLISQISKTKDLVYKGSDVVDLNEITKRLVELPNVDKSDVEDLLNKQGKVDSGEIELNSSGSIKSGNVIFPDVLHLNDSTKTNINTKLGFIHAPSPVAKFNLVVVDKGSYYEVSIFVRDGESFIYSDGRLVETTIKRYSESIMEPALIGKLEKKEPTIFSLSKECVYNNSPCYSVEAGSTVDYFIKFRVNGPEKVSNIYLKDIATSNTYSGFKFNSLTKGGTPMDIYANGFITYWDNAEEFLINIGEASNDVEYVLHFTAYIKDSLPNDTRVYNKALLYQGGNEVITAEVNFLVKNQPPATPSVSIEKNCSANVNGPFVDHCGNFGPGDIVYFKIDVRTINADALNVVVDDVYNSGVYVNNRNTNLVATKGTAVQRDNSGITWNIPDLRVSDGVVSLTYRGQIINNISARSNETNTAKLYINSTNFVAEDTARYNVILPVNPQDPDPIISITKKCTDYANRNNTNSYLDHCGNFARNENVCYMVVVGVTNANASSVVVRDDHNIQFLGGAISDVSTSKGNLFDNNGSHEWRIGDMLINTSETLRYCQTIKADAPAQNNINAEARVYINTNQYRGMDNAMFNVLTPSLTIDKSCVVKGTNTPCDAASLNPNQEVTYRITTTNNGQATALNVQVEDILPSGRLTITNLPTNYSATQNGDRITWNLGTLAVGQSRTVAFDARINDRDDQTTWTVNNIARATADHVPTVEDNTQFVVVKLPAGTPRLTLVKECFARGTTNPCATSNLRVGDGVTYNIRVSSVGTATANNVTVVDVYPTQISNISFVTQAGNIADGRINWSLGNMPVGAVVNLTYNGTIRAGSEGQTVRNVATARADNVDPITDDTEFGVGGSDIFEASKACVSREDTSKACADAALVPGDWVIYQIHVNNNGTIQWQNVAVKDTYDSRYISEIRSISHAGVHNQQNGIIEWYLGNIAPGQTVTVTFEARISPQALDGVTQRLIVNTGVVSSDNFNDINVRNEFTISAINGGETPRTGGLEIISGLILASLVGYGSYLFYQRKKKSDFSPPRNSEF